MYLAENSDIIQEIALNTDELETDGVMPLIKGCINGDLSSQRKMYEEFAPFVKGVVIRYIPNREVAKDLLNEIFTRVFTKLELYKPNGPFKGWLRTIAVNIIIDHVRKNKKHEQTDATDFGDFDVYMPEDVVSKISYKELLVVIGTLPETHRTVFNLFVFENLTHSEISSLLDISINNSRWYLSDARKRLKEKLNKLM